MLAGVTCSTVNSINTKYNNTITKLTVQLATTGVPIIVAIKHIWN